MREYNKRKRVEFKAEFVRIYGGKCERCGIADERVLTIEHVNGGGREERRHLSPFIVMRRAARSNQRDNKYALLCFNCNWLSYLERQAKEETDDRPN